MEMRSKICKVPWVNLNQMRYVIKTRTPEARIFEVKLLMFLCDDVFAAIREKTLNANLIPADPAYKHIYHSYVRNIYGACMKGVEWQTG